MRDVIKKLDKIDFNDCYYHHLAQLDNLIIVTNDVDFAEQGESNLDIAARWRSMSNEDKASWR